MEELLFGWKLSSLPSWLALGTIVSIPMHPTHFVFHYLDDLSFLDLSLPCLCVVTQAVVCAIREASFLVLEKTTCQCSTYSSRHVGGFECWDHYFVCTYWSTTMVDVVALGHLKSPIIQR